MTKRELIDEIVAINHTASPQFLARFQDDELDEYLGHLRVLARPRLSGNAERYEKYFRNCPTTQPARPLWRTDSERIEQILASDARSPQAAELEPAVATATAVAEAPPTTGQEELTSLSVSAAEREQLLAELDDAAADIEDRIDQDDQTDDAAAGLAVQARQAEKGEGEAPVGPYEQGDYVPQAPLALIVEVPHADDADLDEQEDQSADFLAEDDDRDGLTDYRIDCDSEVEPAPQTDYVPVHAETEAPAESVGVAPADARSPQDKGRKDESENWLF
jgi:hypothetical protein